MDVTTDNPLGKHILIVDDDPLMLRVFSGNFAKAGFEVLQAHDGNEGREMARRLKPDLILMDLRMPVMGGAEALTRMREEEETKNLPIAIFTNEDLSLEAESGLKQIGASACINKSAPFPQVLEEVKKLLGI